MARRSELLKALAVTAELTGTQLSDAAMTALATVLQVHSDSSVLVALARCRVEVRPGGLTLGAVLERLDDGHLGPEQAWALVAALTEEDTVIWTDQIAHAWMAARPILHDRVAARMAFLEAYRVAVATARATGARPRWWVSLGLDPARRTGPVLEAVEAGRLPEAVIRAVLPPHEWPGATVPALPPGDGPEQARALVAVVARSASLRPEPRLGRPTLAR